MTKQEFVERVSQRAGIGRGEASRLLDSVLDSITDALKSGEEISFTGFGKFAAAERKARTGMNPRTGEKVDIPAARVPRFSAGSQLKTAVKG